MEILSNIINGLSIGGTYAMIALGYTMVYGIAKMLNFAHGDIIMTSGYVMYIFIMLLGFNPLLALLVAAVVCTILGFVIEKLAYKPLRGASPLAVLITAIGVSYLLQSAAQMIFGAQYKAVKVAELGVIKLGSVDVKTSVIVTVIASFVIMTLLTLFVKYTRIGRAMVAVSEDRGAAQLMGINTNAIISLTFAIGAVLAAVAGYFILMKDVPAKFDMGAMPGIKAFTAAVIGGIGSIPGAMLGGIIIGMIESFVLSSPLSPFVEAIEFLILIIILLVKPSGILGKKRREKV